MSWYIKQRKSTPVLCFRINEDCPWAKTSASLQWTRISGADIVYLANSSPLFFWPGMYFFLREIFTLIWRWLFRTLTTSFYLCFGVFCYYRHFDRASKDQTRFRSSQIRDEIADSLCTLFWGSMLTAPVFTAQIRGYSKIYPLGSASWWYEMAQYPLFLLFSDTWMYWMHRIFHTPLLFRALHSKHHRWGLFAPSTGELADMSAIQLCDTHAVLSICVSSSGSVAHEFGHLCLQLYLANVGCCSGDCLLHSQCMDVLTAYVAKFPSTAVCDRQSSHNRC